MSAIAQGYLPDTLAQRHHSNRSRLQQFCTEIAEDLVCPMCFEFFTDPRLLHCGHTFCLSCIALVAQEEQTPCPLCRTVTTQGRSELNQLKRNFLAGRLLEKLRQFDEHNRKCEECQTADCVVKCRQCRVRLCHPCSEKIHTLKIYSDHATSLLSSEDFPELAALERPEMCIESNIKPDLCYSLFKSWVESLWLAPLALKEAIITVPRLVYVPHWVFEFLVDLSPNVGPRRVTPVKVFVPVCRDSDVPHIALRAIAQWEVEDRHLRPIPGNFPCSILDRIGEVEDARGVARTEAIERERQNQPRSNVQSKNNVELAPECVCKLEVLLYFPIILSSYSHNGQTYPIVVNGQTGKLYSDRPLSRLKMASVGIAALSAAIWQLRN